MVVKRSASRIDASKAGVAIVVVVERNVCSHAIDKRARTPRLFVVPRTSHDYSIALPNEKYEQFVLRKILVAVIECTHN